MNYRKIITTALVVAIMFVTSTCFARITSDDLVIDGLYSIYPGQPWSEIINQLGQPVSTVQSDGKLYYFFNDGVILMYDNECLTLCISTKKVATARNIRIDATRDAVMSAYGTPDGQQPKNDYGYSSLSYFTGKGKESLQFIMKNDRLTLITISGDVNSSRPSSVSSSSPAVQKEHRQDTDTDTDSDTDSAPAPVKDIPERELDINGICPGQTMDYVVKICGKPSYIEKQDPFLIYSYNSVFFVIGRLDNENKVFSVAAYEKGFKTPSGFMVGMPFADVVEKYHKVKSAKFKGEGVESDLEGCKDYTYFCGEQQMVFLVDKQGVVRGIRVEEIDEEKFEKREMEKEKEEYMQSLGLFGLILRKL